MLDSLKDQLQDAGFQTAYERLVEKYPFLRRDKQVRARLIAENECGLLIETTYKGDHRFGGPVRRIVTPEYWENNYWEGAN